MTTGEKIRMRRLELKMTMDDLGAAIGVQRSAINKYEKDQIDLKTSTILALSRVLDVPVLYLLDDDPDDAITPEERQLISAYRSADPGIQSSVRKLLDIPEDAPGTASSAI